VNDEWLTQEDTHKDFLALGRGPWTVVYRSWSTSKQDNGGVYCAFAPPTYRERALGDPGWDLMVTDGRPGFSQGPGENGELVTTYHREGDDREVEPPHRGLLEPGELFLELDPAVVGHQPTLPVT